MRVVRAIAQVAVEVPGPNPFDGPNVEPVYEPQHQETTLLAIICPGFIGCP